MEDKPQILQWTAPECPYRVAIPAPVINEIRILAVEAFYSVPRGGVEIGGVFFGNREPDTLHIHAHRPIPCQYSTGPSFTLSIKDQLGLSGLLEQASQDPDLEGMDPLGWYHSHTRSDIFLSPVDLQLYSEFFPEKWQIALVLRPTNLQPTSAGFFFRNRSGIIKSDAPIQEFKLEPPGFGLEPFDPDPPAAKPHEGPPPALPTPIVPAATVSVPAPIMPAAIVPAATASVPAPIVPAAIIPAATASVPAPIMPAATVSAPAPVMPATSAAATTTALSPAPKPKPNPAPNPVPGTAPNRAPNPGPELVPVAVQPAKIPAAPAGPAMPTAAPAPSPPASTAFAIDFAPAVPQAPVEFTLPSFLAKPKPRTRWNRRWFWVLGGITVLLCGAAAALLSWDKFTKPMDLGLETYDINGAFLIRWDRDSRVIRSATHATLEIQDGGEKPPPIELTPLELLVGGYGYMRRTGQVSVHMKVNGATPAEEYSNFNGAQSLGSLPPPKSEEALGLAQALEEKEHLKTELINESMQSVALRREIASLRRQLAEARARTTPPPAQ